jgi:zinc protease
LDIKVILSEPRERIFRTAKKSNMPDRSRPPLIKGIEQLKLPEPQKILLGNGVPMYVLSMGRQEVCKLEIVFRAGRPYEHKQLVARATSSLMREGTANYTGRLIAEEMDYYGCSLKTPFNIDVNTVTLYVVNKHLDQVLPLLADVISAPAFSQKELDSFIKRNQQRLQIDLAKSDVQAYRKITELIFGSHHPYGYNSFSETYTQLDREDLFRHFHRLHTSGNAMVFLSGKVDRDMIQKIDDTLSSVIPGGAQVAPNIPETDTRPDRFYLSQKDSLQTAVRMGRRLFSRHHPDYPGMYVLNNLLGGYFGSRLMTNIRERLGYTYNIYSIIDPMVFDGGLYIGTEVSNDAVEDTIRQIHIELDRLRNELVGEEELYMLRNYTLGYLLSLLDGVFGMAEVIKTLYIDGLSVSFIDQISKVVKEITAEELRALAQQYLRQEDLWEVVVGPLAP